MYNSRMTVHAELVDTRNIAAFCKRWKVVEFGLFGSVTRDDFSQKSDIDALVAFDGHSNWGLFDHLRMKKELETIFGRPVDLVTRRALDQSRNALLRAEILDSLKIIYSASGTSHVKTQG